MVGTAQRWQDAMPWTIDSGALMGQVKELLLVTFTKRLVSPTIVLDITAL
jgi:hypothetical protein